MRGILPLTRAGSANAKMNAERTSISGEGQKHHFVDMLYTEQMKASPVTAGQILGFPMVPSSRKTNFDKFNSEHEL
jgi:hypothetical protein